MEINTSIIDQQVSGIIESNPSFFENMQDEKKKSTAFTLLCIKTSLGVDLNTVYNEYLVDGSSDFGVDGIYIGEVDDGEFDVKLFQCKYKIKDLSGESNFPANAVEKSISTINTLFDPYKPISLNNKIAPKVEEIRSLIKDGNIPSINFIFCNNGKKWNANAEQLIQNAGFSPDQVVFTYYNQDNIVEILRSKKKINENIHMAGKIIIEDFNFKRVLIGKIPLSQVVEIFNRHDNLLLERNIRRYLGLHSNRVNSAIFETITSNDKRENFYFYNNGITAICDQFRTNSPQGENNIVQISGMQIINGGQTCKTIQQTVNDYPNLINVLSNTYVLLRLYEIPPESEDFVNDITFATNSQNPVDLRDLHSNDEIQQNLEIGMRSLGFVYKRKREDMISSNSTYIYSSIVAEAVLTIIKKSPHQAKFLKRELFGKLYNTIFKDLNAAQAIMAVHIFRFVENERKRPTILEYNFLPYSGHYAAMRLAILLQQRLRINFDDINHRNYKQVYDYFTEYKVDLYRQSIEDIKDVLQNFYREAELSLQQLSATFRRGDLIEKLIKVQ